MEEDWCSLKHLKIRDDPKSTYHVVVKETILSRLTGVCNANIGKVLPGMLVEAVGVENQDALRVRVHSKKKEEIWQKTEWKCHRIDLLQVSPLIWQLLYPVQSLQDRVRLAKNKQFCKDVEEIKPNTKVWYCPDTNNLVTCLAQVKFIGPVPELGDGHYFGLDLDNPDICKPSALVNKYFKTFVSPGAFATLSNINTRKTDALDAIKNFEKNFLSNDILQSKTTDNFFMAKNNELVNSRKNDVFREEKYYSFKDTDNNNGAVGAFKREVSNDKTMYPKKNTALKELIKLKEQSQDDNKKLYRNLKVFDPLNSDNEEDEGAHKIPKKSSNKKDLNIGTSVKVLMDNGAHYGIVRWIGSPGGPNSKKLMAAIELEDTHPLGTDGTYNETRYFECGPQKALFTDVKDCHHYDTAPITATSSSTRKPELRDIEKKKSAVIRGAVPPISVKGNLDKICGKFRGIQGHYNSCYLDATLFSMFAFTCAFDSLIYRLPNENDGPHYEEIQRVLREEIVNPLRLNIFVAADHVMKLRTLLEESSSVSGLTTEEKDPEEFLTSLVAQTLNAEPYLKLSSGQDTYLYQLFVEKDEKLIIPTVQQLLEQSFMTSDIKLKEVPSCFIIQMPRFGKAFKMYSKIQPSLLLDVTDIIDESPRQCTVCGKLAEYECKECFGQCGEGLESTAFCRKCLDKVHCHEKRCNHKPKVLTVPLDYEMLKQDVTVSRTYMELLAVVCIETSHYVAFVKCGPGLDAPWCFFDSMADREGEQNGYNIPEMVPCPDFPYWLSEEGANYLATVTDDRLLPEHAKRLLCDAYMCMYQSADASYQ